MHNMNHIPPRKKIFSRGLIIGLVAAAAVGFFLIIALIVLIGFLGPSMRGKKKGKVALLDVQGPIYDTRELIRDLHYYRDTHSIKAIVVRIDTPGGSAAASQELYEEMNKVRRGDKPVIVSMGSVAASGGYYIACGGDEIFANPGTLTGSIGVIMNFTNWETLVKKVGLRFDVIKSGKNKDIGSPNRPMTEDEKALLQDIIDDVYMQFVDDVYAARKPSLIQAFNRQKALEDDDATSLSVRAYLHEICDGRIFSGRQAREYGMVDTLGNLNDAINRAAKLSGLSLPPKVYQKKKPSTIFDILGKSMKQTFQGIAPNSPTIEYRFDPGVM
jgi:protease IV